MPFCNEWMNPKERRDSIIAQRTCLAVDVSSVGPGFTAHLNRAIRDGSCSTREEPPYASSELKRAEEAEERNVKEVEGEEGVRMY
jgi:hypothetical protein